ncbi:ATP-grasp domain-containing protein [Streptomyces sp. NPDC002130]|uniref:ATP-grasp domain-containing protein n=1 Tax=Streptomyces sp. NPDC002130 TaxID=3155568 RepID=UPI00331D4DA1
MIALVIPASSGAQLADALQEEGAAFLEVHPEDRAPLAGTERTGIKTVLHSDLDSTAEQLSALGVRTIVAGSEFGVTLADELAERLRLPYHRHELRSARRDKYRMQQALAEAGLAHARSAVVRTEDELRTLLASWASYPLVIKPFNSAGSDGCQICSTMDEALTAFRAVVGRRNLMGEINEGVLAQDFLSGSQYIVNTVSMDGRHLLAELYAERIDHIEGSPVLRHIISRTIPDEREQELVDYTMSCLDALGFKDGAAHTEVMLTAAGPRLVEVNSRLMGPYLSPDAYHCAFGYSSPHLVAERLLRPDDFRNRFDLPYGPARTLAKVFLRAHRPGILTSADGLRELRRLPGFHSAARLPQVNDVLRDTQLTTGSCGTAFFVHEDAELIEHSLAVLHEMEDSGTLFQVSEVGG